MKFGLVLSGILKLGCALTLNSMQKSIPIIRLPLNTDCFLTLIGCVHGSSFSSEMVENAIERHNPSCIALELCPLRFQSMPQEARAYKEYCKERSENSNFWQDLAANIPGREFLTAINLAEERNIPIFTCDEDVEVILTELKSIGNISPILQDASLIGSTFSHLKHAFTGESSLSTKSIHIGRVLVSNPKLLSETIFRILPTWLPLVLTMQWLASQIESVDSSKQFGLLDGVSILFSAYALSAFVVGCKKIVVDRDEIIANKLRDIVSTMTIDKCTPDARVEVVAVLGMIHLNGVARHLRQATETSSQSTAFKGVKVQQAMLHE